MASRKNESETAQAMTFEASLEKLESIVSTMESGDISLEESLKAFEEGIKLTRHAQKSLTEAEQKVEVLLESSGEIVGKPFLEPEE